MKNGTVKHNPEDQEEREGDANSYGVCVRFKTRNIFSDLIIHYDVMLILGFFL